MFCLTVYIYKSRINDIWQMLIGSERSDAVQVESTSTLDEIEF